MPNPVALVADAVALSTQLQTTLAQLQAELNAPTPAQLDNVTKEADGRLTQAGIDALYAHFAAGRSTNREISERHALSLSATLKRKAMWRKGLRL